MKNSRLLAWCLAAVAVGLAVGGWWYAQRSKVAPASVVQAAPVVTPGQAPAAKPVAGTRLQPIQNLDRRTESPPREAGRAERETSRESRRAAAAKLEAELPGVRVDFDEALGSPKFVASTRGFLATTPGGAGDPPQVVKTFLDGHAALFGHGAAVLEQAKLVRDYATAHNGLRTLVWQQELEGVRVFESTLQAHVTKNGELVNVASRLVPDPATAAVKAPERIDAKAAVSAAGQEVGDPLPTTQIAENAPPEGPARKQRLRSTRLLDISVETVWLPEDETAMRLCWEVIFKSKLRGEMYRSLVDAETGVVVVRQGLTEYISDATYHVFTSDSPSPFSPGHATPLSTQPPLVARTAVTTPALNTTASPNGWIDDGVNETRGNNVAAHTDTNADDIADTPRPQGSPFRVFNPPLDLTQAPSTYKDAAVVDLFYWNNLIHDRFYELGFTEAAGNFQNNNFGRGGAGNDAVQADAQDGSGTNNANFSTPPDGSAGRMQMYVFSGPAPDRDGDFDHEIVIHEYTHGLSNRLVGGGVGLSNLQSRGMGEGWSDFYALCLLSQPTDDPNAVYSKGGYATYQLGGMTTNYYFGIRRYPYSTDVTKNPLTFKDIDPTKASPHTGVPLSPRYSSSNSDPAAVHGQGTVWCVTLWDVRANLIAKHGGTVGNNLALQLVTDGMKLSPANPNFLQARDAIIQADMVNNGGTNFGELWSGFAKRGMGTNATSPASSTTTGVVENYQVPDPLGISPSATWTVTHMTGTPFSSTQNYTLVNGGATPFEWSATKTQPWLALSQASGTLAPGASTTVTASFSPAVGLLGVGNYADTIAFRNVTSGVNQLRSVALTVEPLLVSVFSETWESGTVRSMWTIAGATTYRTQVTTGNGPHSGSYHLTMDSSSDGTYARNEATLTLDLSGKQDLRLRFWVKMFNEEPDGPPTIPFTGSANFDGVAISADGTQWYEVQGLRTFNNAWVSYTVDLDAAIATHGLAYNANFKIRFNQFDNFTISTDGMAFDDIEILQAVGNRLSMTLPVSASEDAGTVNGTLHVQPVSATDLTVSLSSSAAPQASVPASVVVPAGQAEVPFTITLVDDALLEGPHTVSFTATAANYASGLGILAVNDNETAVLSVLLPANATEGAGSVAGTVFVDTTAVADVAVQLSSSATNEVTVPASVTILAGHTSANFDATIVNDARIDGAIATTITAQVPGWTSGSAIITVADNESTALNLTLPTQVVEGATGIGSVSIAGTLPTDLVVTLESSHPAELGVPASVTIPVGSTAATFAITAVDDAVLDGPQAPTITASAAGFGADSGPVATVDNDVHHFTFAAVPSPQVSGAAFGVTITARDAAEAVVTGFTGSVSLSASGGLTIFPATTGNFSNGQWTGLMTLSNLGTGVVVTVTHASGATGQSNAINLIGADYTFLENWPTFGNGPAHPGYQPETLGTVAFEAGWTKVFPQGSNGIHPVAVSNGRVFVTPYHTNSAGFISAIDASDGTALWQNNYATSYAMNPPTVNAGRVFVQRTASSASQLLCVDAGSGSAVWTAPFSAQSNRYEAPTVVNDGVWINGGSSGGLYGFNASDGSQRFFNATLPQQDRWTPAYHNGTLYTWTGGIFRAHDPLTGAVLWSTTVGLGGDKGVPVLAGNRGFVVGSSRIYAIDLTTRAVAWSVNSNFFGTPAVANGIVYVFNNTDVRAYHADTGAVVGAYATGTLLLEGQPIVTNDTLIAVSTSTISIFTLGTSTPRQIIGHTGGAILAHGALYVAGPDGVLRTFYPGGQTLITVALPAAASEGSAQQTGTVSLSKVRGEDTEISLTSGNPTRLTVAANVTIPAGQTSANFNFSVLDDTLPNGSEDVTITAKGPTYLLRTGRGNVRVDDNEPVVLALIAVASMNEGTIQQVMLEATPAPSRDVTVTLTSSDISEIITPMTTVLPAGQASVVFLVEAMDDGANDGPQPVTLTAHVNGWSDGTAAVTVIDNGRDITRDWSTFGNGPNHLGYQPLSLGTATYQSAWSANFPTAATSGLQQVAVKDGVVYVTPSNTFFGDTFLAALHTDTGAQLWRAGFTASFSISPPTVDAGKVYVQKGHATGATGSALYALDARSGGLEWSAPVAAQWSNHYAPTVFENGVWVNGGEFGGLYGFNTSNGTQRFFTSLAQYDLWTPAYYRGKVYSWVAGVFREHDALTGAVLGSTTLSTGNPYSMNTVAVIEAGKAYVVGNPDLFAVDVATRATVWRASGTFRGTPTVALGVVYAITGSDVKAFHAQTGALLATYATGSTTISGQPIVTDDSLIVSSPTNTYIFTLGASTPRQTIAQGGHASLANGVLYLASNTGLLRTYRPAGMATLAVTTPASAAEGSAPLSATVTLSEAQVADTVIEILSSHPSRLTTPGSVTIPAGETSAPFSLGVVDDALRNGTQSVVVSARGPDHRFLSGSSAVTIHDNENVVISVTVPTAVAENATNVTGTVTLSGAAETNITVNLQSSDTTEATVAAKVVVLAGQTSATFPITIVNDTLIDGPQPVTFSASVTGWTGGAGTMNVTDNENTNLTVTTPTSITEENSATGTVTISGTLPSALVVTLNSSNPNRLSVPATVTIAAGSTSVNFTVTAVANTAADGSTPVNILASASGFSNGIRTLTVVDNDLHHFTLSTIASPQTAGVPFSVTFTAKNLDGSTISFNGTGTLTASFGGSTRPVTPTSVTFTNGTATASVSIFGAGPNVMLEIRDSTGKIGTSPLFAVNAGPVDHFDISAISSPQVAGTPFGVTVTAKDASNSTVTSFTSTAALSAGPVATVTGTGSTSATFILGPAIQRRCQILYLASEVGAAGKITSLAVQASPTATGTLPSFVVRMKHTALTSQSAAWDSTGWTTVYAANQPISTTGATWIVLPLTTPFQYNGTSNLLVDVSSNGASIAGNSICTARSGARVIGFAGSGYADPLTWSGTSNPGPSSSSAVPNLRVQLERNLPMTPTTTGAFVNGVWTGNVTINEGANGINLQAAYGTTVLGTSNTFSVSGTPVLSVTPAGGYHATANYGGAATPANAAWTVTNTGTGAMVWNVTKDLAGLSFSPSSGILAPGASVTVTGSFNTAGINPGTYQGTISFANASNGLGDTTRAASLLVSLAAPVLAPEPAVTGSSGNTVSWSAVSGASEYEAQVADNASFTSAVSSGWIGATSHTFAPLADGVTYHYRVRARMLASSAANRWAQTSESEFATGAATDVSTSASPGSVVLQASPVSWTADLNETGASFSNTIFASIGSTLFRREALGAGSGIPNTTPPLPINVSGDVEGLFVPPNSLVTGGRVSMPSEPGSIMQNGSIEGYIAFGYTSGTSPQSGGFDLRMNSGATSYYTASIVTTSANTANLTITKVANSSLSTLVASSDFSTSFANENYKLRFSANGSTLTASVWRVAISNGAVVETPIVLNTGTNSLTVTDTALASGVVGLRASGTQPNVIMYDDIVVTHASANFASSGSLTAVPVVPGSFGRWGTLSITGNTAGAGTSLKVDVLNAAGTLLAANVPHGADLAGVPAIAAASSIRLRANLATTNSDYTPSLDEWAVTWLSPINGGWSSAVTSLQDAAAPVVTVTSPAVAGSAAYTLIGTASDAFGIAEIRVNGVPVTTGDDFLNWSMAVTLHAGQNALTIEAWDTVTPANMRTLTFHVLCQADLNGNGLPDAWETQHGLSETITALGDLDSDGLRNIVEYALCLDPKSADGAQAYWTTRELNPADGKQYLVLHFRRRIGLDHAGWTIEVETSPNAIDWNSSIACEQAQPPTTMADGETEVHHLRVLAPMEPDGATKAFVRLRVRPL